MVAFSAWCLRWASPTGYIGHWGLSAEALLGERIRGLKNISKEIFSFEFKKKYLTSEERARNIQEKISRRHKSHGICKVNIKKAKYKETKALKVLISDRISKF
jgi:ribosomal protein S18